MLRIKTPATVEPVTLSEAKLHAGVHPDTTDDDSMLEGIIAAARVKFEEESRYLLTERTFEWEVNATDVGVDREGKNVLILPVRPVLAVNSIGDLTEPSESEEGDWKLDVDDKGVGRIRLADGISISEETIVEFTAGYPIEIGEEEEAKPAVVGGAELTLAKRAILMLVAHWYRNREGYDERNIRSVAGTFESVVRNFQYAI